MATIGSTNESTVYLADANGDGDLDLFRGDLVAEKVFLHTAGGTGVFSAGVEVGNEVWRGIPVLLGTDRGNMDLLLLGSTVGGGAILIGNGDGSFGAPTDFTNNLPVVGGCIGGLNGDRNADVVVAFGGTVTDHAYLGKSNGTMGDGYDLATDGIDVVSCAVGDLNGDGALDIVLGTLGAPNRIHMGNL